jgi:hypothetical protein
MMIIIDRLVPRLRFILILFLFVQVQRIVGDFVYADFRETRGLVFNGDTGTTSCEFDPLVCIMLYLIDLDFSSL